MLWSIDTCQNKVFADQYRAHVRLSCKRGRVVGNPVNANPVLKLNQSKISLVKNVFHCFCFVVSWSIQTQNRRASSIHRKAGFN